jgi:hypothetical protein
LDGPRGLASLSGVATARLHAQGMPAILQEAKVRGRTAPAARSREPIADRSETQKPNHSHPRSGRLLYPPFGGRSPDENQSGTDEHVKRHVGPVRRKRQATCLREQTCEGLSENLRAPPGVSAKTARPARPRWPDWPIAERRVVKGPRRMIGHGRRTRSWLSPAWLASRRRDITANRSQD